MQRGYSISTRRTANLLVLLIGFLFLHLERVKAFEIDQIGLIENGHFDALLINYDPETQATRTAAFGNSTSSGPFASFFVSPQAGDVQSGTVQLRIGYRTTERLQQNLLNYTPAPFDYHYAFEYRMGPEWEWANHRVSGPSHPLEETGGGLGFLLLEATIGERFYLEFLTDAGDVHIGWGARDWHPTLIDPTQPGTAEMYFSGNITLVSIEVVPEPTAAAIVMLGASFLGIALRKRGRFS